MSYTFVYIQLRQTSSRALLFFGYMLIRLGNLMIMKKVDDFLSYVVKVANELSQLGDLWFYLGPLPSKRDSGIQASLEYISLISNFIVGIRTI